MKLRGFSRATLAALGLVALFLLALALTTAGLFRSGQQNALSDSQAEVTRFVNSAEAGLNRNLLGVDILLTTIAGQLDLSKRLHSEIEPLQASRLMQSVVQANLLVQYVALLNAQGSVLASSEAIGGNLSVVLPPGFAQDTLAQWVPTLTISAPKLSFSSAETVLYFGRRFKTSDGANLLAVAEVKMTTLTSILLQGVDIPGLEVTLETRAGQLLASAPYVDKLVGKQLAVPLDEPLIEKPGQHLPSRLGGLPSIMAVRPALTPNVLIAASVPIDIALLDWRKQRQFVLGVAILFGLMILAAGGFAIWYFHHLRRSQLAVTQDKVILDQALSSMVNGFLLLNGEHQVVQWNRRYEEIFPWQAGNMTPMMPYRQMMNLAAIKRLPSGSEAEIQSWVDARMAMLLDPKGTHDVHQPNGRIIEVTEQRTPSGGVVLTFQDVTQLRKAIDEIEHLAFYDTLTALPNRRLLTDRVQQALSASNRSGRFGALLFLDLDHFKTLNDTLGHDMGDLLLLQVAQRLKACVRAEDTVARLGGDEFVVMLQSQSPQAIEAAALAKTIGEKILNSINQPFDLENHSYNCGCSIGATFFGLGQQTPTDLLRQADIAMYQAKHSGRNALCFFDPEMLAAITARSDMEKDLKRALAGDQFRLFYQVQMTHGGISVGAEALIRWQHPQLGLVSPAAFIGLAEETGLIVPIGKWVLQTACAQLKSWESRPKLMSLQLSVNVSARQFRQADFVDDVRKALALSGADPTRLELELTESLVLDNVTDTIQKMKELKSLGVRLSMDDFGTGYSSLAYLTQLPLDQLKIDQSFVRNIGIQSTDSVIIQTIIGMAHNLGLEVIAEGVETKGQQDFLLQHGCPLCQGYLFSKPLPLSEFEQFMH